MLDNLTSLIVAFPSTEMPCEKVDELDIDNVTVPAFAVSLLVLKPSWPGTAERLTV
ncbi:MAG: hypothetical protein M3022_03990 [Actinomycetota bacterium]|nr:hypothetical protein [Actinomycetota bacterium]